MSYPNYFLITEFDSMHQSIFNTEIYNSVLGFSQRKY